MTTVSCWFTSQINRRQTHISAIPSTLGAICFCIGRGTLLWAQQGRRRQPLIKPSPRQQKKYGCLSILGCFSQHGPFGREFTGNPRKNPPPILKMSCLSKQLLLVGRLSFWRFPFVVWTQTERDLQGATELAESATQALRAPLSTMEWIGSITYRSSTLPTLMPVYPASALAIIHPMWSLEPMSFSFVTATKCPNLGAAITFHMVIAPTFPLVCFRNCVICVHRVAST